MEQNNDYKIFEIICDNEEIIKKAIEIYNMAYNKDFTLVEYIFDEVNFAKIGGHISLSDIFDLGCMYMRMLNNNSIS
jgi:hypothetical protein